jgi:hypothetical protein
VSEFQDLQSLGKGDQARNVVGNDLLGTDREIDSEIAVVEQTRLIEEIAGAQACDTGWHIEHTVRDLAGNKIGVVALGHRNQQVGVAGTGLAQRHWRRPVTTDGAQIETVLKSGKPHRIAVYDDNVVFLGNQVLGNTGANLAGAEDDDLHDRYRI